MMPEPTYVILDEEDASKLLQRLYNGKRPAKVHLLICLCGAIADLWVSASAWNGWQVLPHAKCPKCLDIALVGVVESLYPDRARMIFNSYLQEICQGVKEF
jgi:hypothetical protein